MSAELSGRELRQAVAEKLGWTGLFVAYSHQYKGKELFGYRLGSGVAEIVPHWQLSLDACFEDLLPWATGRDWLLTLWQDSGGWIVEFTTLQDVEMRIEGEGLTAAIAICRAFLRLP